MTQSSCSIDEDIVVVCSQSGAKVASKAEGFLRSIVAVESDQLLNDKNSSDSFVGIGAVANNLAQSMVEVGVELLKRLRW